MYLSVLCIFDSLLHQCFLKDLIQICFLSGANNRGDRGSLSALDVCGYLPFQRNCVVAKYENSFLWDFYFIFCMFVLFLPPTQNEDIWLLALKKRHVVSRYPHYFLGNLPLVQVLRLAALRGSSEIWVYLAALKGTRMKLLPSQQVNSFCIKFRI